MVNKNVRNEIRRVTAEYIKKAYTRNEEGPRGLNIDKFVVEYLGHIQRLLQLPGDWKPSHQLSSQLGARAKDWLQYPKKELELVLESCTVAYSVINLMLGGKGNCHIFIINLTGYDVHVFDADRHIATLRQDCEKQDVPRVHMRRLKEHVGENFIVPVDWSHSKADPLKWVYGVNYLVNPDVAIHLRFKTSDQFHVLTYDGRVMTGDMGLGIYTHKLHLLS